MATITYTIPDNKLTKFKLWFLAEYPVDLDDEEQPLMSENDWIKDCGKNFFLNACERGKNKLAMEAVAFDMEVIE